MKKAVIEIDNTQLLNALEQLPNKELKKMIDMLFLRRLFKKPNFEEVSAKARKVIRNQGLEAKVVEEAQQWARKQR